MSTGCEYGELSAAMLEKVPLSIRSNVKLADLTEFLHQLQQHLGKDGWDYNYPMFICTHIFLQTTTAILYKKKSIILL